MLPSARDPFAIATLGAAYIEGLQYGPGAAEVSAADNPHGYKKIGSVAKHLSADNFEVRRRLLDDRIDRS